MPTVVCPECRRKLQLPEAALAREARCPMCGFGFVAEADGATGRGLSLRPLEETAPPAEPSREPPLARPVGRTEQTSTKRDEPRQRRSQQSKTILVLACVCLFAVLALIGFVVYSKMTSHKNRIVGTWQAEASVHTPDVRFYQFHTDGYVLIEFMSGDKRKANYKIEGDILEISSEDRFGEWQESGGMRQFQIMILNSSELVLQTREEKVLQYSLPFKRIAHRDILLSR